VADLLGATIGLACGVGMYAPITSMFFRALETEFHWSKAAIAGALVALPLTGVVLPFSAPDRPPWGSAGGGNLRGPHGGVVPLSCRS